MARLNALAAFTEVPGQLTRRYLSTAHIEARRQVERWMVEAGMSVRIDPLGSAFGRYEGMQSGAPAIMLGSHIDTVVDAGKYDGNLGVLAAVAAVADMARKGERLSHAVEVAAFGEEEGSRFPTHILTSSALIGAVKPSLLDSQDKDGISLREALRLAGGDASAYRDCVRTKGEIASYLELHIEQGPVLEDKGLALAAVVAINGSTRLTIEVEGFAGHAGTVPMSARRDALAAASEMVLAVERLARSAPDLVGTVGRIEISPNVTNVIPGAAKFNIDVRSSSDAIRRRTVKTLVATLREVAARRRVGIEAQTYQENPAVALDPIVTDAIAQSISECGHEPLRMSSGAGHDAMIMQKLCPSGMIFLRCKGGISHNPAESITAEDADIGVRVLLEAVRRVDRRLQRQS